MKRITQNFELIFATGICLLLAMPFWASAQKKMKNTYSIEINGRDTVINGKKIGQLSARERKEALDMIGKGPADVLTKKPGRVRAEGRAPDGPDKPAFHFRTDSNRRVMIFRGDSLMRGQNMVRDFRFDFDGGDPHIWASGAPMRGLGVFGAKRSNTQSFSFSNVDRDGIETRMDFRLGDAPATDAKRLGATENAPLISDVVLYPDFSTTKISMNMNLNARSAASAELKDREGKVYWSERSTAGKLSGSFALPKNGLYFLVVKQAGKTAVKQFIKD